MAAEAAAVAAGEVQLSMLQPGRRYEPIRVLGRGSYGLAMLARLAPASPGAPPSSAGGPPSCAGAAPPALQALAPPAPARPCGSGGAGAARPSGGRCSCLGAGWRGQRPASAPRTHRRPSAARGASTPPLAPALSPVGPELGELRVVKKVDLPGEDEACRAEVLQEIRVLRGLSHPNIIGYYEAFTEDTSVCIAMEYADGGDLAASIARRRSAGGQRFQEREAMAVFAQLTLAVQYLHEERRILHRDLKSANVFLTSAGVVKLGDFGIAKVLRPSARCAETRVGSPYYLPPEICESQPYDFKADVWCLGVVFYEVLALEVPFSAQNIAALVVRIITTEPPPLPSMYSSETHALAMRLLAKRPRERPAIGEVAAFPHVRRSVAGLAAMGAAANSGPAAAAARPRGASSRPLLTRGHSSTAPVGSLPSSEPTTAVTATARSTEAGAGAASGFLPRERGSASSQDSFLSVTAAVDLAEVEYLIRESPAKRPRPSGQPRVFGGLDRETAELACATPPAPGFPPPVRSGWSGPGSGETFDLAELEVLLGLKRAQDPPSVSPPPPVLGPGGGAGPAAPAVAAGPAPAAPDVAAPTSAAAAPAAAAAAAPAAAGGGAAKKGALAARGPLVAAAPTPLRQRLPQMRRSLEADFRKA